VRPTPVRPNPHRRSRRCLDRRRRRHPSPRPRNSRLARARPSRPPIRQPDLRPEPVCGDRNRPVLLSRPKTAGVRRVREDVVLHGAAEQIPRRCVKQFLIRSDVELRAPCAGAFVVNTQSAAASMNINQERAPWRTRKQRSPS
jgi:hypothetical protein